MTTSDDRGSIDEDLTTILLLNWGPRVEFTGSGYETGESSNRKGFSFCINLVKKDTMFNSRTFKGIHFFNFRIFMINNLTLIRR